MARFIRTRTWLITLLRALRVAPETFDGPPLEATLFEAWLAQALEDRGFTRSLPDDALGRLGLAESVRYDEYPLVNTTAHQLLIGSALLTRAGLSDAGDGHARLLLAGLACMVDHAELIDQAYALLDLTPGEMAEDEGRRLLGALARALGDALAELTLPADHPLLGHPFHQLVLLQDALHFGRVLWAVARARGAGGQPGEPGGRPEPRALLRAAGLTTSALQHAISAAVAMMAADGEADSEEKRLLTALVEAARLTQTDTDMFLAELDHPHTADEIADLVTEPHERHAILRLLFLAAHINGDYNPPERAFLDALAARFEVSPDQFDRYEVEALLGYQQHAGLVDKLSFSSAVRRMRRRAFEHAEDFVRDNAARIWGEIRETSELGQLILKASQEDLSPEERRRVRAQLKDLARVMPALALFALPGGSVVLPLLAKHLPFNLLPSTYLDEQDLAPQAASGAASVAASAGPASTGEASGRAASTGEASGKAASTGAASTGGTTAESATAESATAESATAESATAASLMAASAIA